MMASKRISVSLQRTPEPRQASAAAQALQQTFTAPGSDASRDKDSESSVAVLDTIDAILRKRHTRRASVLTG